MMFVVTLTHPPELCLSRKEFSAEFTRWLDGTEALEKNLGMKIHGAYACPTEHTFCVIPEAKDPERVTAFFAGIMLTHHKARISPGISLRKAADILIR